MPQQLFVVVVEKEMNEISLSSKSEATFLYPAAAISPGAH